MPVYEYYCRECGVTFEKLHRRTPVAAGEAACPAGHDGASRTLSLFATTGRALGADEPAVTGGGCCGGGACACSTGGFSRN